jgi:adenylate cyclase
MDIVFAEPDRTSPQSMAAAWNLPEDLRRRLAGLADHDEVLARTIRHGRVVLGFAAERDGPEKPLPTRPSDSSFPVPLPSLLCIPLKAR